MRRVPVAPSRPAARPRVLALAVALPLAALVLAGFTQPPVSPEHSLRYTRERGGSCTVMIPYYGPQVLWIGRMAGRRNLDISADRIFDDNRAEESCFFLEEDCQRWVRGLRAAYPDGAGYAYCRFLGEGGDLSGGGKVVRKP